MTAGTALRTFTLTVAGERPLTINRVAQMHRQAWAAHTREVRRIWWAEAIANKLPHLDRIAVTITPLHANGRSPQDVAACAPEAKAAIDGLVDAHVIPDDTATHLIGITFLPPKVAGIDGLQLTITEV